MTCSAALGTLRGPQFDDLVHLHRPRGTIAVAERVSVSINRSTGSAEEQHLTSFEAAGGDEALHTLTGRVRGYLEPVQVGLLVTALRLPTHFGAGEGPRPRSYRDPGDRNHTAHSFVVLPSRGG